MDFKVKSLNRDDVDASVASMKATEGQTASPDSTDLGEATFAQNCLGCHAISAVTPAGAAGPNLTTPGDRNRVAGFLEHTKDNVEAWIKNPEKYKPGNLMAGKYKDLTDEEISAVADYLMGLSVEK